MSRTKPIVKAGKEMKWLNKGGERGMRLLRRLTACRPLRNARGTRLRTNRLQNSRTGLFC